MRITSLREQTLALIRQSLISGEYKPGDIISATAMATQLNVSNSPVREAMLELVSQGILEVVRNRGFRVIDVSDHDLDEIFEVRLWLEARAMRELAAKQVDVEDLRHLAVGTVEAARERLPRDFLAIDREFHLGLLSKLGNGRLSGIVENLRDQTRLYGIPHLAESGLLESSGQEHVEILDAIQSGDPDRAEAVMAKHLTHIRRDWASGRTAAEAAATTNAQA